MGRETLSADDLKAIYSVRRTRPRPPVAPEAPGLSFDPIAHAQGPVHLNFSHPTSASPTVDGQTRFETMPTWRPLVGPGPVPSGPALRPPRRREMHAVSRSCGPWEMGTSAGDQDGASERAPPQPTHMQASTNSADARTLAKMSDRSHVRASIAHGYCTK